MATLADRVRAQPLTVVLGASGTGKSSVVKAGLLPYLRATEPDAWQILPPIRPGKSPLASLAGLSLPGEQADDLGAHLAEFRIDPEALARRVGAWAEREPSWSIAPAGHRPVRGTDHALLGRRRARPVPAALATCPGRAPRRAFASC